MRRYYIVKSRSCSKEEELPEMHEAQKPSNHAEETEETNETYKVYNDPDFNAYVKKHGMHFTDELAEKAISALVPVGEKNKTKWPVAKIIDIIKSYNLKTQHDTTPGDLAYQANLYYMTLYSDMIKTELDCIRAAVATDMDPNAYPGNIFTRWLADVMTKPIKIDWKKYV